MVEATIIGMFSLLVVGVIILFIFDRENIRRDREEIEQMIEKFEAEVEELRASARRLLDDTHRPH